MEVLLSITTEHRVAPIDITKETRQHVRWPANQVIPGTNTYNAATYALVFIHRKLQVTLPKILIRLEYKKTVYVIVLERGALSISSTTIIMERI